MNETINVIIFGLDAYKMSTIHVFNHKGGVFIL